MVDAVVIPRDTVDFKLSVVIPCWHDEEELVRLLKSIDWPADWQIIVALAPVEEDVDENKQVDFLLQKIGQTNADFNIIHAEQLGRGQQMNAGARAACGAWLWFVHADTLLQPEHITAMQKHIDGKDALPWGAFYRKYDDRHPWLIHLEGIERVWCRRRGFIWGDQCLFVRADFFQKIGGYKNISLMEDVAFCEAARLLCRYPCLLDPSLGSSPRRFKVKNPTKVTVKNLFCLLLYKIGIPADKLHRWYYSATSSPQHHQKNE